MGRIARVLSSEAATRRGVSLFDVKCDLGGGEIVVAEQFTTAGQSGRPVKGDYAILAEIARTGGYAVVGYVDANGEKPGEVTIKSRDSDGNDQVTVSLSAGGVGRISNGSGHIELEAGGEVNINGVRIPTAGDVVTAAGVSLDNHPHNQGNDAGGDAQVPTDAPTPTE